MDELCGDPCPITTGDHYRCALPADHPGRHRLSGGGGTVGTVGVITLGGGQGGSVGGSHAGPSFRYDVEWDRIGGDDGVSKETSS